MARDKLLERKKTSRVEKVQCQKQHRCNCKLLESSNYFECWIPLAFAHFPSPMGIETKLLKSVQFRLCGDVTSDIENGKNLNERIESFKENLQFL